MINGNPVNNGSLIHTQSHAHIHIYNLMLNAQNNMIIMLVFLVIIVLNSGQLTLIAHPGQAALGEQNVRVYSVCRLPIFAVALNSSAILVPNIGKLTVQTLVKLLRSSSLTRVCTFCH